VETVKVKVKVKARMQAAVKEVAQEQVEAPEAVVN